MNKQECDSIWQQVRKYIKAGPVRPGFCPDRIFQILGAGQDGDVLFSWPPPRLFPRAPDGSALASAGSETYADGSYFADDFAHLARSLSLTSDPSAGQHAKTSCTRRFGAEHEVHSEGLHRKVRSIIIPYGDLLIACFEVVSQTPLLPRSTLLFDPRPSEDATAAAQLLLGTAEHAAAQQQQALLSGAGLNGHQHRGSNAWDTSFGSNSSRPLDSLADASLTFELMSEDEKRAKLGDTSQSFGGKQNSSGVATLAAVAINAAAQGDDDNANKTCTSCGTTNSPEWRKGPSGKKTLCNACGLRFARQSARAKKKEEAAAAAAAKGIVLGAGGKKGKGGDGKGKKKKGRASTGATAPSAPSPSSPDDISAPQAAINETEHDLSGSGFPHSAALSHHDFSQHTAAAMDLGVQIDGSNAYHPHRGYGAPAAMYRGASGGAGAAGAMSALSASSGYYHPQVRTTQQQPYQQQQQAQQQQSQAGAYGYPSQSGMASYYGGYGQ